MSEHYDFHYQPTGSGAISGQQVLEQTEDAINELGDYVYDNVGGAMDVAQEALETAQNAEQDAQTALDTANSFSSAIQSAQQDANTALSTAQTAQTTASNANATAIQASQDASSAVTTANNASGQVSTLSGTVTALGQRVTTAEGNIGQNTSDITALTTRVGTAEGNITTLQNDVSIAQGNASSAMATAGTVKQQSYVLRYSSTTLVASSTNSNSLLDNTDNLKVGDKVIDASGVIYSVTAIDTANSTFTIGTSLIDLAQDSDVVHKSGNETIRGTKDFTDSLRVYNSDSSANTAQLWLKNSKVNRGQNVYGDQAIWFRDATDKPVTAIISRVSSLGTSMLMLYAYNVDQNNQQVSNYLSFTKNLDGTCFLLPDQNDVVELGSTGARWKSVYATNYYYGSNNVEFSSKFVTTDTAQTVSGSKTFSSNVNVYNSDNTADTPNIILKNSKAERGSTTNTGEQTIFFLDKDDAQIGHVKCEVDSNGVSTLTLQCTNSSNGSSGIRLRRTSTGTFLQPVYNSGCNLGTTAYRWFDVQTNRVNGVEPSSLSLPSGNNSDRIDISSYFSNRGTGETNSYVASANGWIYLRLGDISSCQATVYDSNNNLMWGQSTTGNVEQITIPILKGQTLTTQWATGSAVTVANARFIPCQGNV